MAWWANSCSPGVMERCFVVSSMTQMVAGKADCSHCSIVSPNNSGVRLLWTSQLTSHCVIYWTGEHFSPGEWLLTAGISWALSQQPLTSWRLHLDTPKTHAHGVGWVQHNNTHTYIDTPTCTHMYCTCYIANRHKIKVHYVKVAIHLCFLLQRSLINLDAHVSEDNVINNR